MSRFFYIEGSIKYQKCNNSPPLFFFLSLFLCLALSLNKCFVGLLGNQPSTELPPKSSINFYSRPPKQALAAPVPQTSPFCIFQWDGEGKRSLLTAVSCLGEPLKDCKNETDNSGLDLTCHRMDGTLGPMLCIWLVTEFDQCSGWMGSPLPVRTKTFSSFSPPKLKESWVVLGSISLPGVTSCQFDPHPSPLIAKAVIFPTALIEESSHINNSHTNKITYIWLRHAHSMFQEEQICSSNCFGCN